MRTLVVCLDARMNNGVKSDLQSGKKYSCLFLFLCDVYKTAGKFILKKSPVCFLHQVYRLFFYHESLWYMEN